MNSKLLGRGEDCVNSGVLLLLLVCLLLREGDIPRLSKCSTDT